MSKVELLPNDLDFIKQPASIDAAMFRGAAWLLSDFMAPIWKCQFVSGRENAKTINFSVRLDDGLLLIDRIHESLLVAIKSYLCLMSHPLATGGI